MKSVLIYAVGLLLCLLVLGIMPVAGEEEIYDDVIRLHILANSDCEEDQVCKLAVRNAILAEYGEDLAGATTEEAVARVESLLPEIKEFTEKTLADLGRHDTVTVVFDKEIYPERVYEDLHFPAGTYRSLRILIGAGEGKNWWCVLFPPLCIGSASEDVAVSSPDACPDGLSDGAWRLVSQRGEYQIRFRVLEWLMGN